MKAIFCINPTIILHSPRIPQALNRYSSATTKVASYLAIYNCLAGTPLHSFYDSVHVKCYINLSMPNLNSFFSLYRGIQTDIHGRFETDSEKLLLTMKERAESLQMKYRATLTSDRQIVFTVLPPIMKRCHRLWFVQLDN